MPHHHLADDVEQRRLRSLAIALALALLAWSLWANLVLGESFYVRRNLVLTVGLLLLARASGLSATELGLGRDHLGRGLRWGLASAVLVLLALVVGVALQDRIGLVALLLGDERAAQPEGGLVFQTTLRIPLGTALFEELAFRGVLLALTARLLSTWAAVVASSVVFGLWHVAPTMVALRVNDVAPSSVEGVVGIVGAVLVTLVAGIAFCWLRIRSRSLLAPILAHWATNSLGLLAAASTGSS
jgi:uncharacterized protein